MDRHEAVRIQSAHYNDPVTSFMAADRAVKTGLVSRQAMAVFIAVQGNPGRTSRELAELCELDRWAIARRLPELVRVGIIRRGEKRKCEIADTLAVTWWPKERRLDP